MLHAHHQSSNCTKSGLKLKLSKMEPRSNLKKRPIEAELERCIICQNDKRNDKLFTGSEQGIRKLYEVAQERFEKVDYVYRQSIERIRSSNVENDQIKWHKICYASFTSRTNISRLKDPNTVPLSNSSSSEVSTATGGKTARQLRSQSCTANWSLCIFCQEYKNDSLHSVESFHTSDKIIRSVPYDHNLSIILAGVSDLIAAEAKYHLRCYTRFLKETSMIKNDAKTNGIAMEWLCAEISNKASKGHILELEVVWERFKVLCSKSGEEIPSSFQSKRTSFKHKLQSLVVKDYEFHVLPRTADLNKCTVILAKKNFSHSD